MVINGASHQGCSDFLTITLIAHILNVHGRKYELYVSIKYNNK